MAAFRLAVAMIAVSFGWSVFVFYAQAADFAGGWASDAATCNKVFVKKGGKIIFADDSDSFGSGLIVEENKIIGKLATCSIRSRKEEGAVTHFILNCATDVALQAVQFSVRIDSDNKITRLFPGLSELSTSYYRCTL